jgi:hypothetical protein
MRTSVTTVALVLAFAGLAAGEAGAQLVGRSETVYTWRGTIPDGRLFTIRNFNGPITVRPAAGNTTELRAEKKPRGGASVTDVAFDVRTSSNGDVTVCATRDDDSCDGSRRGHDNWRHREITVEMTVLVPRGVRVRLGPGNGEVEVRGAKGRVHVSTGNGDVTVATSEGPVEVSSGNGDIDVRMAALRAREDMEFHTGSGDVHVTLPANYNGELDASTGNGTIQSDFDLKVKGRFDPRHVRATIGDGGPMLRMTTGNGEFEIRKG